MAVQSAKGIEGLEWKSGVPGTTGEIGGTGIDGPGSSGWSRTSEGPLVQPRRGRARWQAERTKREEERELVR